MNFNLSMDAIDLNKIKMRYRKADFSTKTVRFQNQEKTNLSAAHYKLNDSQCRVNSPTTKMNELKQLVCPC